jgi:hypothetical protein
MDKVTFMMEVEKSFLRCKKVLLAKEKDYAIESPDRLIQFKKLGNMETKKATEVLFTLADKHISSIADMVKSPYSYNLKQWHQKTTDLHNYLFLLEALLVDLGTV